MAHLEPTETDRIAGELLALEEDLAANKQAILTLGKRIYELEERQRSDESKFLTIAQRFHRQTIALAGLAVIVASGVTGLQLSSDQNTHLQGILYALIGSGTLGVGLLPFAKEQDADV